MKSQYADENTYVVESNCNPNPGEAEACGSLRLSSQSSQIKEQQGQRESSDEDTRHWPQSSSAIFTYRNAHKSVSFLSVCRCLLLSPYVNLRLKFGICCLRINLSLVKKVSSKFKVCWKVLPHYGKLFNQTHYFIVDTQRSRGIQIIAGVGN